MFIRVNEKSIVYILCSAGVVTGGVELLHQLADSLSLLKVESRIVYMGDGDKTKPKEYAQYSVNIAADIIDEEENVLVVGETLLHKLFAYKKIQKLAWWLSVDNFYKNYKHSLSIRDLFLWNSKMARRRMWSLIKNKFRCVCVEGDGGGGGAVFCQ